MKETKERIKGLELIARESIIRTQEQNTGLENKNREYKRYLMY